MRMPFAFCELQVPEFDVPGHSKGFEPLAWGEDPKILFCSDDVSSGNQLYDDPAGVTYKTIHALMGEMAALFTDEVFNIGSDETSAKGRCTVNTSFAIERRLLNAIQNDFKKTPAGWEEVLFDAGAATPQTIVDAWARHTPAQITATGRRAIQSSSSHFYFTGAATGGPAGWSRSWWDISEGMTAAQKPLLLGGEMSMWTDTYCYINQCQSGGQPVGHALFPPEQDEAFQRSIGGMIWPRGFVAAASYWNWRNGTDPSSPPFVQSIWKLNDALRARNLSTCPTNCSCDQVSACGKPYIEAPPVGKGRKINMADCGAVLHNRWNVTHAVQPDGSMKIMLVDSPAAKPAEHPLCWGYGDTEEKECTGCLELVDCVGAPFFKHAIDGNLVDSATGFCVDMADDTLGAWSCGKSGQPNQRFAVDAMTGMIVSAANGYNAEKAFAGMCATVSNNI
eukprot:SAG31_NODE_3609_length_4070_cov_2.814153_1_plen_450_part_00